jgi:hypothetical protein
MEGRKNTLERIVNLLAGYALRCSGINPPALASFRLPKVENPSTSDRHQEEIGLRSRQCESGLGTAVIGQKNS